MMQPMTIEGLLSSRLAQPNVQAPVNMEVAPEQPQQPLGGGVWGQGGRLITPEQAQMQRARAQELSAIDYSPIGSPWQGLARVLGNVQGALQARGVKKAEERTAEHNQQLMAQLSSGLSGGADGSSPTSAPNIEAILLDRYANPAVRGYAENLQKQRQAREMKQYEADLKNRETVWEDNYGNRWRNQASGMPEDKPFWIDNTPKFDSQMVTDPTTGMQTLVRTPMANPYGQPQAQQGMPAIGAVVADPRKASQPSVDVGPALDRMDATKTISSADLSAIMQSLGPNGQAKAQEWMRNNGIKVVN